MQNIMSQTMIPPEPEPLSASPEGTDYVIKRNKDWSPVFQTVTARGIDFTMCRIPAGRFRMGSSDRSYRSEPAHDQHITQAYWISVYMVTNAQWRQAVEQSAGVIKQPWYINVYNDPDRAQHPVVSINWYQCQDFVNWLGEGWRLPTEAEWEFAARGPDSLVDPLHGRPEGATWVGAQDMGGHTWEWTSTIFRAYPYDATDGREDLTARGNRTYRNVGWLVRPGVSADASGRIGISPNAAGKNRGMRLCITKL